MLATSDLQQMGIATVPPTLSGIAMGETFPLQIPQAGQKFQINLDFPDFQALQISSLVDFRYEVEKNLVIIKFLLDRDVIGIIELKGELTDSSDQFRIDEYFFSTELVRESARANFVSSTFKALLGLSSETHLQISEMNLDGKLRFVFELYQISKMLQLRQTGHRLMVIENALGIEFPLPQSSFSRVEIELIGFIYRAITERSFLWSFDRDSIVIPANESTLKRLEPLDQPTAKSFYIENVGETLLGQSVLLGDMRLIIAEAVIENAEEVRERLKLNDGQLVKLIVNSLIGQAKHEFSTTSTLPQNTWEPNIQALIELEPKLDAELCKRYNDLAAATLTGLSEEEIAEITTGSEFILGIGEEDSDGDIS